MATDRTSPAPPTLGEQTRRRTLLLGIAVPVLTAGRAATIPAWVQRLIDDQAEREADPLSGQASGRS